MSELGFSVASFTQLILTERLHTRAYLHLLSSRRSCVEASISDRQIAFESTLSFLLSSSLSSSFLRPSRAEISHIRLDKWLSREPNCQTCKVSGPLFLSLSSLSSLSRVQVGPFRRLNKLRYHAPRRWPHVDARHALPLHRRQIAVAQIIAPTSPAFEKAETIAAFRGQGNHATTRAFSRRAARDFTVTTGHDNLCARTPRVSHPSSTVS